MDWLSENWFWIAIAIFFIWMHRGGHCGGHGGHEGHEGHGRDGDEIDEASERHSTVTARGSKRSMDLEAH